MRRSRVMPTDRPDPLPDQPDADRFAALYESCARDIFRFCYRRLHDADAANDATSRIFLKALNRFADFHPDASNPGATFRAWLFRIARNDLIDYQRVRRFHASIDREHSRMTLIDPRRTPEEHALAADADRRVRDLLDHLPPTQREIVELRLAGLTGAEIARTLEMSLSAIKSAQYRAYQTLRSIAHPDAGENLP